MQTRTFSVREWICRN